MDQALANARYAVGGALAALRAELRLETAYAAGTVARRIGELAAELARHGAAQTAYLQARVSLEEALGQAPDDVVAHNEKGIALRRLADLQHQRGDATAACDRLREARSLLDQALALAPNHPEIAAEHARVAGRLRLVPASG